MGNQQERSYAWLAGIVDGEGSVSFQVYTLPDGRIRITPYIAVVNSDEGIIAECERVIGELLVNSPHGKLRRCDRQYQHDKGFTTTKHCTNLRVDGVAVKYILEAIGPHLRSVKRKNADNILKYLELRETGLLIRDTAGRLQRHGYRRSEIDLVVATRTHKRAKSSEAICSAPNVVG